MEIVLLADLQNSFGSQWIRVANTEGVDDLHVGDRFREQGFGHGAEELQVDGVDISKVGGMSKIYVIRGAGATRPEVHRMGCVFQLVGVTIDNAQAFVNGDGGFLPPSADPLIVENATEYPSIRQQAAGLDDPIEGLPEPALAGVATPRSSAAVRQQRYRERKRQAK